VSGTLPSAKQPERSPANFEDQVRAVLQHCERILAVAGCRLDDVVQRTAYVVGIGTGPVSTEYTASDSVPTGRHEPSSRFPSYTTAF
jgi:enamine deaminase RidA (YjgF/YER057c/UK114 family)